MSLNKEGNMSFESDLAQNTFTSRLSPSGDHIFAIAQIVFCTLSVIGNSCILILFAYRRSQLNPVEILLLNLGIVDLLLAVASYPMSTISAFYHRWVFGLDGCYFYAFTCYFLGLTGMFSIASIAVLRFMTTCNNSPTSLQITRKTAWKIIAACYSKAFGWAVLPLLKIGEYSFEPFQLSCTLNWLAVSTASKIYISLVTVFCVAIPTGLIMISYSRIIQTVRQSDQLMRKNGIKRNGSDYQLTLATGLISMGFMVAWFPYTFVSLYSTFISGQVVLPLWATPIPVTLAKSSIAYTPVIYLFFPRSYRKEFSKIIGSWRERIWSSERKHETGEKSSSGKVKRELHRLETGYPGNSGETNSAQNQSRSDNLSK